MERSPRSCHHLSNPSFSSSLLDAIDRSIDQSDAPIATPFHSPPPTLENPSFTRKYELGNIISNNHSHSRRSSMSTVTSNSSSFGGFSSEAESPIITYRPKPIRTTNMARPGNSRSSLPPPPPPEKKKKRSGPISFCGRIRELGTSSRGTLANFLSTLFSRARKPKVLSLARDDESMQSSSSCCTRSSICKVTPSGRRSGIVKSSGGEQEFTLSSPLPVTQSKTAPMVKNGAGDSRARRRRVEEMLRGVGEMEEDGWESDSSEDLFEIENLIRVGREGEYGDELPVFGTTNFETNRAIARDEVYIKKWGGTYGAASNCLLGRKVSDLLLSGPALLLAGLEAFDHLLVSMPPRCSRLHPPPSPVVIVNASSPSSTLHSRD